MITNLLISQVELRSEESPDIKPYTHSRTMEKIVVPLGDDISRIKGKYLQVTFVLCLLHLISGFGELSLVSV